ncbi:hypothetical protein ACSSS7_000354 [Eimeria intestinalis]
MAIDRFCCCALTSKQLAESAGVIMNDGNESSIEADATSSVSDVSKPLQTLRGDTQSNMVADREQAATCFLAITHSDTEHFAPLYADTVKHLFPALQAFLQQRPQGKGTSSVTPKGTAAAEHQKNGWHPYLLAGCLGALELFDSHSPLAAGCLTAQSSPAFLGRVAAKLPRVSIKATISGNLPLVYLFKSTSTEQD